MAEIARDRDERYLTVQEAALRVGVTDAAIRNAIYRRKLPTVRKYGRNLIPLAAFSAYREKVRPGRPSKGSRGKT